MFPPTHLLDANAPSPAPNSRSPQIQFSFFKPAYQLHQIPFAFSSKSNSFPHSSAPAPARDTLRVPLLLGFSLSCQRTCSYLRYNSFPPNQIHYHHAGGPAPARQTIRVSLQFEFSFVEFMLAHQFPSGPVPERVTIRVPSNSPSCQRTSSSTQFALPQNPVLILHASAPARDTLRVRSAGRRTSEGDVWTGFNLKDCQALCRAKKVLKELRAAKDAGEGLVILCQRTILCE
jgi:hypothetical protein